ncbi:MAG TPA: TetR/AcrR family transcriptional regulator [Solirubrobacteraceae bacterium]|jgi:AcrR family transcriptional regulator
MTAPVASTITEDRSWERQAEILDAAHQVLARDGVAALSVGRLAEELGISAAEMHAHHPGRDALLDLIAEDALEDLAAALEQAGGGLWQSARAYRRLALHNPALYRLVTERPLPPERPARELELRAGAALIDDLGPDLARAAWAFAHGMVELELDRRFPAGTDLEAIWAAGVRAFERAGVGEGTNLNRAAAEG